VIIQNGRYVPPKMPGYSAEMKAESLDRFEFPAGMGWSSVASKHG
jgi:L-fuconate dehydratase